MSTSCNINFFKPSSFAIILRSTEERIEFMIQECNIPGLNLGEMLVPHMSQNQQRPGDNIVWNPLSLQVLLDENLDAFSQAFNYVISQKNPETATIEDQTFDGYLNLTSNKNNLSKQLHFHDAWIKSIGDVPLSNSQAEEDPVVFTIEIEYDYYEMRDVG